MKKQWNPLEYFCYKDFFIAGIFRPKWNQWSTDIIVEFNTDIINADQVINLLACAGHYIGVMEGRPERHALSWGRWTVGDTSYSTRYGKLA